VRIEKANELGLCFGVKRAIGIVEKVAREQGGIETLGALAHNQQVIEKLAAIGVRVVKDINDIQGDTVAISSHGVSPHVEEVIRAKHIKIINTTCPSVRRAQLAAQRLAKASFFVVVYGDAKHIEVKGVLGWADGKGIATLDENLLKKLDQVPRRLGILSQTTQIPEHFTEFVKKLVDSTLTKNAELYIIDTICHSTRKRQTAAIKLAEKADLMLVIGSRTSANTNRLAELCAVVTKTYLVETTEEIKPSWLKGKQHIGITAGASTDEQTINEVVACLEALAKGL
jgi:4-hydroxy-3-methylbut-2-enyl diphosphate reductase